MDKIAGLFGKTRQGYYDRMRATKSNEINKDKIMELVLQKRQRMPRLGTRKLHYLLKDELKREGIKMGRDKFFELLGTTDMLVKRRRSYTRTTNSKHWMMKYPNLIKELDINRADQVWVSDITYIRTSEGFYYLSLVTDAYSKKILAYRLSKTLESYQTEEALLMAIKSRRGTEKLIHHSDRGIQYCSKNYVKLLNKHNIGISMTDDGNVYENAIAERVNGILKEEFGVGEILYSFEQANKLIRKAIKIYNNERPHLSCSMMTPDKAHSASVSLTKMWKSYQRKSFNKHKSLDNLLTC